MPLPIILGTVARMAGGALARGAASRAGASAGVESMAGRVGQFVGGATFNTAAQRIEDREAERETNPQDDDRR
jgi:hypothetical protein